MIDGLIETYYQYPDGNRELLHACRNLVSLDWIVIACQLFGRDQSGYRPDAVYLEFENTISPGTVVTVPAYDETEGVDYYESLSGSTTRDYLRVPVLDPVAFSLSNNPATDTLPYDTLTWLSRTAGTQGVHGKTFSDTVNSTVFGLALVSTPSWADRSLDRIYARSYYPTNRQVPKQANSQIVVSWTHTYRSAN